MYNYKVILKSLLLAPIPLLSFSAIFVLIANQEFSFYSIAVIFLIHALFYLFIYCCLSIPIAYIISIFLNKYQKLNFITIFLGTVIIWLILSLPIQYIFGGNQHEKWWLVFNWQFYSMILFTGLCYWLFLKYLHKKNA